MNVSEERNYQKLMETLDLLELSRENRELAEAYLDCSAPEKRELLAKLKKQDFARLDKDKQQKAKAYAEHLQKRGRMEEMERFVRFAAAAGGSTACYVLVSYGWNLDKYKEWLTPAQQAAIRAEAIAWSAWQLQDAAKNIGQKDPEILRQAVKLCYNKSGNAGVLLAGLSLRYEKSDKGPGGFLKGLLSKERFSSEKNPLQKTKKEIAETVKNLEDSLISSIENLFVGTAPSGEDIKKLENFVRTQDPKKGMLSAQNSGELSPEILSIIQGKQFSEYLISLLAGAAFLGMERSPALVGFLRLMAAMDREAGRTAVLDTCLKIGGRQWFDEHIETLEDILPLDQVAFVLWCLVHNADGSLGRLSRNNPGVIRRAMPDVPTQYYDYLLELIKRENPDLYKEVSASGQEDFRRRLAQEFTSRYMQVQSGGVSGQQEAIRYLLGEAELEAVYPFVNGWRKDWRYDNNRARKMYELKKSGREPALFRRAVVMEGLCQRSAFFVSYWYGKYHKIDREEIAGILAVFEEEKLPFSYQMEALGGIWEGFYQEKDKTAFINECVAVLSRRMEQWKEDFAAQAREGSVFNRFLSIRILDVYWKEYRDVLLACAMDSARQVRELLEAVYVSHKEWEPRIRAMLSSKKSQERELAVRVLKNWGVDSCREELENALAVEKSKKIRELLQDCLGIASQEPEQSGEKGEKTTADLAGEILKGGKKRKVSWALEGPLPEVHRTDGSPASQEELAAILVTYADMGTPGVNKEASRLAAGLISSELAVWINRIFVKWLDIGAEAKKKWVLYAASIHGGEQIVPALYAQIQEWPAAARGAMAAEAVKALALNGSATALLLVDQISRKFKFRQVKTAAGEALSWAARELGISRDELEDRIVPDLGFDERMERSFDYGSRRFKVILTPTLELQVFDEEGKKLKSLPAPGKRDEAEKAQAASGEFKLLKKQLKTVVSNQKLRLEQALSAERRWPVEKWRALFVENPVMHQFAMGLIWGVYEDGALKDTFRYMEDGSFNTVDGEEYELAEGGLAGLVHPIELTQEEREAWKEQLSDYEVVQPIEQLERPVFRMTEQEREQKELTRFGGKLLNGLSLSGKLQGQGWYRGSVQDAGGYYSFYREDGEMGVELEFSGAFVGDENEEVTVYGARFYKAGTVKRGSYVYDTIKKENLYRLGEVSPRYFSEIVLQLTKATASSQEQLAYPECRK